ncbi:MAG TPA: hypothetical protein VGM13_06475 [Thermoanaerobaculia bacterium]|jgi:hypothetical protein
MTSPATPNLRISPPPSGFALIGGGADTVARTGGPIIVIPFDVVPTVANGAALTSVQARAYINSAHRVRRVYFAANGAATATGKLDVYAQAGTPASILAAAKTIAAAATVYASDPVSTGGADGPAEYTLRADTVATSAAFTDVKAYLEVELLS